MKHKEYGLYKGCKKANPRTQKSVFDIYYPVLLGICKRYCQSNDEAQDIVQESFITIFSKIESFTWNGDSSFSNWMKRIATNAAINSYKKQSSKTFVELEDSVEEQIRDTEFDIEDIHKLEPDHLIESDINMKVILSCLEKIPEHFKIAYYMHVIDNYSHKEIADLLHISEKTSTTRVYRARKLLQNEILLLLKNRGN